MSGPIGGTELARDQLMKRLPSELTEKIQIVTRPVDLDEERMKVLWMQDLPLDVPFLAQRSGKDLFDSIVFVSGWQQTVFNMNMNVGFSESVVIRNAIEPIKAEDKAYDGQIRLIYHPTPHRGLEILVPVFEELCKKHDDLHLDVFSSFKIYGRDELDEKFEPLYERCMEHPNITYHGSQPNSVVRDALSRAHIFSYPSIWRETSCMSVMEAMSAKCIVVAPEYAALSETMANFGYSYSWDDRYFEHIARFTAQLERAISDVREGRSEKLLDLQKSYADTFFSWDRRIDEWVEFLSNLTPRKRSKGGFQWL